MMLRTILSFLIVFGFANNYINAKEPEIPPEVKLLLSEKKDENISTEEIIRMLSKGLSTKRIMPVNIQSVDQDNYLFFERDAPLNRQTVHYGTENTKKIETQCNAKRISNGKFSQDVVTLKNVDLMQISKLYQIDRDRYIAIGYDQDLTKSATHQAVIMLIDGKGKMLWKTVVGLEKSYPEAMVKVDNKGYAVVGHDFVWDDEKKMHGSFQLMISLVEKDGKKLWTKHYSPDGGFAKGRDIEKTVDGGYIAVGEVSDKAWIIKIDSMGKMVWNTFFETPRSTARAYAISDNHQDGYIVAGMSNVSGLENDKVWIIKVNYSGKIDLIVPVYIEEPFTLQTVSQINSNEFMLTGFYPHGLSNNAFFMKIDSKGKKVSEKIIGLNQ